MDFGHSEKVLALRGRLEDFMREHIYPNEEQYFAQVTEGERFAHFTAVMGDEVGGDAALAVCRLTVGEIDLHQSNLSRPGW